jgi:hypothetical protein
MKLFTLALLFAAACLLSACESSGNKSPDTSGNGTPLGDSGVRVSGTIQSGGAVNPR